MEEIEYLSVLYAFKRVGPMNTEKDSEFQSECLKTGLVNFCLVLFVVLGRILFLIGQII